jgi:glutathione S-transferase
LITLYELTWSHYCEKVRLALNYMGLPWRAVSIDAFRKRELRGHPLPKQLPEPTVPAIHDATTGAFVMDSTPILRYLAQAYPRSPALFPGGEEDRRAILAKVIEFDTSIGLAARRIGYTQVFSSVRCCFPSSSSGIAPGDSFCRASAVRPRGVLRPCSRSGSPFTIASRRGSTKRWKPT